MTKEYMMNEVMKTIGLENELTIQFCQLAEDNRFTNELVEVAFNWTIDKFYEEMED